MSACAGATSPTTTTASSRPPMATATSDAIETVAVPDVVGKDLAAARATLRAAGFNVVTTEDGTQKTRVPGDDWVVDRQAPRAGQQVLTSVPVYLVLLEKGANPNSTANRPCPSGVRC